jgi:hypothetical protein
MGGMEAAPTITEGYRKVTYRQQVGLYTPFRFETRSWYRFVQDRTANLLRRIGGSPDERQSGLIEQAIRCEWQALKLEAEAETADSDHSRHTKLRIAASYRRALLLADRDLAWTMRGGRPAPKVKAAGNRSLTEITGG